MASMLRGCGLRWPLAISCAALVAGLFYFTSSLQPNRLPSFRSVSNHMVLTDLDLSALSAAVESHGVTAERRLHVFMPADGPNINLCKVVMSSVALGYPLPTLLNWDGDFNRPEWHFAGSHIAKLESLLAVIEELLDNADAHDDDLALMVDAYDTWFQLPPSVLIQRFHQLNRQADERNRKQWEEAINKSPASDFPLQPPRQSIIVTSAKDCHPDSDSGSDPHYELWPPSPMPEDLYGEETDTLTHSVIDSSRKFRRIRPRCVNSGMIMGPMGPMREALRRCKDKVENVARSGRQLWSDQALLAEVIGDQEAWRSWVKELASTWNGTASESRESTSNRHMRNVAAAAMEGVQFEFGIGLDYNFTTFPPTCSSEDDGYFNKIHDKAALRIQSEQAGVPDGVRLPGLPPELGNAPEVKEGPYADINWGVKPLYSDFFFGTTPVGIHHNAYAHGLKPWRLKHWWSRMWFYPMLRELVTYSLRVRREAERMLLNSSLPELQGVVYQAPQEEQVTIFNRPGPASSADFEPVPWDDVCQKGAKPWYDELFGDNGGPLEL